MQATTVHFLQADGLNIFYRSAGPVGAPVVLLLHGFPASSFQYRELIPRLAERYRVIAPDLPGFGFTEVPTERNYAYTFDSLARTILAFTEALGLRRYALYVFDYGAPTGLRLALAHPERVSALITQNGNAYEEGLSEGWAPIQQYWKDPSAANRDALRAMLTPDAIRTQYVEGTPDASAVAPEGYTLDSALLARPGNMEIQLDLFRDYADNVKLYPEFQRYLRTAQPPVLAVWGANDGFFLPPGAEAFRRDVPNAEIHFFNTGHFALETHVEEIAETIKSFLQNAGI